MTRVFDKKFEETFSEKLIGHALFYNWPMSIRFELSRDGTYTQMFSKAMERTKALFNAVFDNSSEIYVDLVFWREKNSYGAKPYLTLQECGFSLPELAERKARKVPSGDELYDSGYFYHYAFKINSYDANAHAILWAIVSNEIGVEPTASVTAYFVDFDKGIVFHPYDDRGLDIVALSTETLVSLYKDYYDWILDYDLKEVQKKLGLKE